MTIWKLIGFAGTLLFGARWLAQFWQSRRAGRSVLGASFWLLTLGGSTTLAIYFTLGPSADAVGLASNLLPFATAAYNLHLILRARAAQAKTSKACSALVSP